MYTVTCQCGDCGKLWDAEVREGEARPDPDGWWCPECVAFWTKTHKVEVREPLFITKMREIVKKQNCGGVTDKNGANIFCDMQTANVCVLVWDKLSESAREKAQKISITKFVKICWGCVN